MPTPGMVLRHTLPAQALNLPLPPGKAGGDDRAFQVAKPATDIAFRLREYHRVSHCESLHVRYTFFRTRIVLRCNRFLPSGVGFCCAK